MLKNNYSPDFWFVGYYSTLTALLDFLTASSSAAIIFILESLLYLELAFLNYPFHMPVNP